MPRLDTLGRWCAALLSAVAIAPGGSVQKQVEWRTETAILAVPDAASGDIYGGAVAVSGEFALIAAEWDDDDGKDSGAVWVFRRSAKGWERVQKLRAPDAQPGDNFGRSIAMDGEVAVIGAHWDDSSGRENAGSAYVYRLHDERWSLEQKLVAADPAAWAALGNAVTVQDDWIAVAAWRKAAAGAREAGAVYLFHRDEDSWRQRQLLHAKDAQAGDQFGRGVCLSGDALLVGAWRDDERGADCGAAYVFRNRDGRWEQEQKLMPGDVPPGDSFGFSVALDGDVALVGSHLSSAGAETSGAAYVFRFDGEAWREEAKLVSSKPGAFESMGEAVSLQGDLALVSAHCTFRANALKPGRAYLFRHTKGGWVESLRLKPSDGHPGDVFSFHVALDGQTAVAGSWRHSHAGTNSGRAYVFENLKR